MAAPTPELGRRLERIFAHVRGLLMATTVAATLALGRPVAAQAQIEPDAVLAAQIAQDLSKLGVKPKTVVLPADQALEVTLAIKKGDYATGRRIAEEMLARSKLQNWRFYPFDEFIGGVGRSGDDPVLFEHLNAWLKADPKCAIARLMRARYLRQAAWAARTEGMVESLPRAKLEEFKNDMNLAKADVQAAITLNPQNPWNYSAMLEILLGGGNSPEMEAAFQAGIKAYRNDYELYRLRLFSLTPKWGGSVQGMNDFVDRYAGPAPATSPLKLLHLQLYAYLLDAAWYSCQSTNGDRQQCIASAMSLITPRELGSQTQQALNLFKVSDPVQFNNALRPILERLLKTVGGSSAEVGTLIQGAATALGSDNRLMDEPVHNSFVLDDITAQIWSQMGNTQNAEKKFKEALSDIEQLPFAEEAQKELATAVVYDDMLRLADRNAQFSSIIVYHEAAVAHGGTNFDDMPYFKCYAYYKLKHFSEAVAECTQLIEGTGNYIQTRYWRAWAYDALMQWDAALADFAPITLSANNWFRVNAAIEMSVIYGKKKDYAGELASLNQYPWLFDASLQSKADLAVSYNNRCFSYMKLGQFEKALEDCTASLKYGNIPDAYQKQQELLKQLASKPTGLTPDQAT